MKEKFIKFLKKNGALRKFKYNLLHVRIILNTFDEYCDGDYFGDITGAFIWSNTREGLEYWAKLSDKWEDSKEK